MQQNGLGKSTVIKNSQYNTVKRPEEICGKCYKMSNTVTENAPGKSADIKCPSGGGFFLTCEAFGRMFDNSFSACAFFFSSFEVEISSCTLIPLFGQDQFTVA